MGRPDATQAELEAACRANANIHEAIAALPQGYQTVGGRARGASLRRPAPAHRDRPPRSCRDAPILNPGRGALLGRRGERGPRSRRRSIASCRGRTTLIFRPPALEHHRGPTASWSWTTARSRRAATHATLIGARTASTGGSWPGRPAAGRRDEGLFDDAPRRPPRTTARSPRAVIPRAAGGDEAPRGACAPAGPGLAGRWAASCSRWASGYHARLRHHLRAGGGGAVAALIGVGLPEARLVVAPR